MKVILFDFFGVLASNVFTTIFLAYGKNPIDNLSEFKEKLELVDTGQITYRQFRDEFARLSGLDIVYLEELLAKHQIIEPGVFDILDRLKAKGYNLGLVSDCVADHLYSICPKETIVNYFNQDVFLSSELGFKKPELFQLALDGINNTPPSEVILIDDREANVVNMTKLGARGLIYTNSLQLEIDLQELGIL